MEGVRGSGNERSATEGEREWRGERGARGAGSDRSATEGAGPARRRGWGEGAAALNPRQGRSLKDAAAPPRSRSGAGPGVVSRGHRWVRGREQRCCRGWWWPCDLGSFTSTGDDGAVGPWYHRATGLARIAAIDLKCGKKKAFYLIFQGELAQVAGISSVRGV